MTTPAKNPPFESREKKHICAAVTLAVCAIAFVAAESSFGEGSSKVFRSAGEVSSTVSADADAVAFSPFDRRVSTAEYASQKNTSEDAASKPNAKVYSNIQNMSGWYTSPDQGHPVCSPKPEVDDRSSKDGTSGKFSLQPTGRYNNCLWPIKLGGSPSVNHFLLDAYYRLSNPAVSQGVEFSSNHHVGTKWYKFSVQCSYNKGVFSIWNTAGKHWFPTDIPCERPKAESWDHLVVETQISDGKAVFLTLSLNGVQHSLHQSFDPLTKPSSYSYGVHFQMNGDVSGHAYYAWVDKMTFTVW